MHQACSINCGLLTHPHKLKSILQPHIQTNYTGHSFLDVSWIMGTYCNVVDDSAAQELVDSRTVLQLELKVHYVKTIEPAEETKHETLYLSNIDQMLVSPVESFFVYMPNPEMIGSENVFGVLENALAKVLVPYHFLAGRFVMNAREGRLELSCNRAGVCFVAASSEQTVDELGDIKQLNPIFRKLVPMPENECASVEDSFLLMVQVTKFKCGGFSVGFRMSHAICDGISSAQFFNSFCKLARGEKLTIFPDPDRTILKPRNPPAPEFEHSECVKLRDLPPTPSLFTQLNYSSKVIPLSLTELQALKTRALADKKITKCSFFEVMVSHMWQARTRTLEFEPHEPSTILFAVDFREKVSPLIPHTFCGNTVISGHVSACAEDVRSKPLSFCVAKVQEAIARIDERYVWSALDWLQVHGGMPAIVKEKDVLVSGWYRFPFYEHDFGWGKPIYGGPSAPASSEFALITSNGTEDGGVHLVVGFRAHEMVRFMKHIKNI